MQGRGEGRAALAAMAGAALIGLSPILIRLSEVGPQATNFWRFVFALPILGLMAARRRAPSRRHLGLLVVAGLLFGLELGFYAAALGYTTVVNATLLSNLTPLVAAGFGWLVLKERIRGEAALGAAVALGGAITLTLAKVHGGVGGGEEGALRWLGDLLGFSSAFGYAAYLIIVRALGGRVSVGAVMFWATLSAAVFAACASLVFHEGILPRSVGGWAVLIANGLLVQLAGQSLIAYGVARLPIAISTVLLWVQPLAAAMMSWVLFGEALTPLAFVGCALILGGVWLVQRTRTNAAANVEAGDA
ncbi:MAG TPA: DMT family transporter [Caulobacterales bacterium]|nr:DMT family transporter [Caulobacterales bacterium]